MLRVAVLSTAKIGRKFVLPAIAKSAHCMLMAMASRDLTRAQQLAAQYNAPYAFASYQEALQCPDVDLVYIPLPTHLHSDWGHQGLGSRQTCAD
ncbi:Gfo/Idh/MocA family protein [Gallaecimonas sp. GXIMD1310]|uniref:Gfo/Idh/MocA family protein n=1 Tax=Gallaecimonas sp. GXIMD1310 TaxID=3131926 RepID=UPI0032434684